MPHKKKEENNYSIYHWSNSHKLNTRDHSDDRYPYVGVGTHCRYCGCKVVKTGVCPKADQHEDHGGF